MRTFLAIYDVDGTITDSAPVITNCVKLALEEMGFPPQSESELKRWVGPPLSVSFRDFVGLETDEQINSAIATYRSFYIDSMLDAPLFPGVRESLQTVYEAGIPMAVATSKIERLAAPILEHLDVAKYFHHIVGSDENDPFQDKAGVIANALKRMESDGFDTSNAVMIGDRFHDIEGGIANGLDTIGILWSGTDPQEFQQASHIAKTPKELGDILIERAEHTEP